MVASFFRDQPYLNVGTRRQRSRRMFRDLLDLKYHLCSGSTAVGDCKERVQGPHLVMLIVWHFRKLRGNWVLAIFFLILLLKDVFRTVGYALNVCRDLSPVGSRNILRLGRYFVRVFIRASAMDFGRILRDLVGINRIFQGNLRNQFIARPCVLVARVRVIVVNSRRVTWQRASRFVVLLQRGNFQRGIVLPLGLVRRKNLRVGRERRFRRNIRGVLSSTSFQLLSVDTVFDHCHRGLRNVAKVCRHFLLVILRGSHTEIV